jgi:PAS domain S-box-containing protein
MNVRVKRPSCPDLAAVERDRLFSIALDLLCVVGADGYFRQLNPAWERTFGVSGAELRSRPVLDFIHPADREGTGERLAEVREAQDQVSWESRFRHAERVVPVAVVVRHAGDG